MSNSRKIFIYLKYVLLIAAMNALNNSCKPALKSSFLEKELKIEDQKEIDNISDFILVHGLGHTDSDMSYFEKELKSYDPSATITNTTQRNNKTYDNTIKEQADMIYPTIKGLILKRNRARIVFIGQSLGGLVIIKAIRKLCDEQSTLDYINNNELEILVIPIGVPWKGCSLIKDAKAFLKSMNGNKDPDQTVLNELSDEKTLEGSMKDDLDFINQKLTNAKIKIHPIAGKSQRGVNELIKTIEWTRTKPKTIVATNPTDTNEMIALLVINRIEYLDNNKGDLVKALNRISDSDTIVKLDSQLATGMIPDEMSIKNNPHSVFDDLIHVNPFNQYKAFEKYIEMHAKQALEFSKFEDELTSPRVLDAIKKISYSSL